MDDTTDPNVVAAPISETLVSKLSSPSAEAMPQLRQHSSSPYVVITVSYIKSSTIIVFLVFSNIGVRTFVV